MSVYIENDRDIELTRGDMLPLTVTADNLIGNDYEFKAGDILEFKVYEKGNPANVVLEKQFTVDKTCTEFYMEIPSEDTRIGELISKPVEYNYELTLNPNTSRTMTIIAHTKKDGAPKFILGVEAGGN